MMQDVNHDDMQQLVTEIAKALVDDPQAVEVQAVARDENTVLRLRVASADVGKVIGKQGRTARSIVSIPTSRCTSSTAGSSSPTAHAGVRTARPSISLTH